jgi:hypothetical protein
VCGVLKIPPDFSKSVPVEKSPVSKKALVSIESEAREPWQPPLEQKQDYENFLGSSFFMPYSQESLKDHLWESMKDLGCFPSLPQFCEYWIEKSLSEAGFDRYRTSLARDFIISLPGWMVSAQHPGRSISLMDLDECWSSRKYHEEASPFLQHFINMGLLAIKEGKVEFTETYMFDLLLVRFKVKEEGDCLLPPEASEIHLSQWIGLLCLEYIQHNHLDKAGLVLMQLQGDFPVMTSGSWGQLAGLIWCLPPIFRRNKWAWTFGSIAAGFGKLLGGYETGISHNGLVFLEALLSSDSDGPDPEARDILKKYLAGVSDIRALSTDRQQIPIPDKEDIQWLFQRLRSPRKWSDKQKYYSLLRCLDPDTPVPGLLPIEKPLYVRLRNKMILANHKERLAIAESLLLMGRPEALRFLGSHAYQSHGNCVREKILRGAEKGLPGYMEWV